MDCAVPTTRSQYQMKFGSSLAAHIVTNRTQQFSTFVFVYKAFFFRCLFPLIELMRQAAVQTASHIHIYACHICFIRM